MKYCIMCKEEDMDAIEDHHTVPRSIIPEWKKTVPLCQKCHKKIHKYILKDMTDIVSAIRDSYDQMNKTFKSVGFSDNINFPVDDLHKKILGVLVSNIPTIGYGSNNKLSIMEIVKQCELDIKPTTTLHSNCQKIGYALKKMRINTKKDSVGRWVIYDRRTINRMAKLQSIFKGLTG